MDSKIRPKDGNQMHLEGKIYLNPKIERAPRRYKNKSSLFSLLPFHFPGGLSSCYPILGRQFVGLSFRCLSWGAC